MAETSYNRESGDTVFIVTAGERASINNVKKLKEQYPDDVDIRCVNDDGTIVAHFPIKWFPKIRPPVKRNFSEEQRAAMGERLKQSRESGAKE